MNAETHTTEMAATQVAVKRFNVAFNRHDVAAIMDAMTEDCVFESTSPPPDGKRYSGQDAVRGAWEDLFRASPDAVFEPEECFVAGDRCVVQWTYRYTGQSGEAGHIRGVDVMRVRDGKVAEK